MQVSDHATYQRQVPTLFDRLLRRPPVLQVEDGLFELRLTTGRDQLAARHHLPRQLRHIRLPTQRRQTDYLLTLLSREEYGGQVGRSPLCISDNKMNLEVFSLFSIETIMCTQRKRWMENSNDSIHITYNS